MARGSCGQVRRAVGAALGKIRNEAEVGGGVAGGRWGAGTRVWGLGFGVWGSGFRVPGFGFRASGVGGTAL